MTNELNSLGVSAIKPMGGPYISAQVAGVDIDLLMEKVLLSDNFWREHGGTLSLVPLNGFYDMMHNCGLGDNQVRFVVREPVEQLLEAVKLFGKGLEKYKGINS